MDGPELAAALKRQVDPEALRLWNRLAEGESAALTPLVTILREDFPSFCGLLLHVRPKGGGRTTPFIFNQVQRRMWSEIVQSLQEGSGVWFVLLKFRQAGMSTFWCAWLFWQMWRQTDVQCMVVAHQKPTAETMIETQKVFYEEIPEVFRPDLREGNHGATIPRGEIYFADRRCWELIHLSKNVDPRGQQVTHVLETEYAMYHDPDELNGALKPQLPPFGSPERARSSFIIESTPKGQNEFYDLYMDAKRGDIPGTRAVFFPWFLFDEQYAAKPPAGFKLTAEEKAEHDRLSKMRMEDYAPAIGGGVPVSMAQMYWRRATITSDYRGNVDRFNQEYPSDDITCFLLSSKSVFREYSMELLKMVKIADARAREAWASVMVEGESVGTRGAVRLRLLPKILDKGHWKPIAGVTFKIHPHGQWLVWEPPVAGHKYVIGGDPAMGLEDGDASVLSVLDVTTARQVAEFTDQMGPERFAIEMAAAGYWYNQALVVPEINGVGYVVLNHLIAKLTYPNLYKWPKFDEVNRYTHKRGWETNSRTKQLMVSSFVNYIEEGLVEIASRDLLEEMSTFESKNEGDYISFAAQKGRHDDRVMAFALAIQGVEQTPVLLSELNRSQSRVPSAHELHLSSAGDNIPPTPLPKQLETFIKVKQTLPWNPMGEGFL